MKSYIPEFPEEKVYTGKKWKFKRRTVFPLKDTNIDVEIEGKYTVEKIEKNKVFIKGEYKIYALNYYPTKVGLRTESKFIGNGKSSIIYNYKKSALLELKEDILLNTETKAFFPDFPTQKFKICLLYTSPSPRD